MFDDQRFPNLAGDHVVQHDIHSVSSVLKLYFRDLPTPLGKYDENIPVMRFHLSLKFYTI